MLKNLPRAVVSLAVVPNDQYAACLQDLEASGAEFERPFHVAMDGCTLEGAVSLISVPTTSGRVSLPGRPTMLCPFAAKFTRWLNEVGAPIVVQRLGSPLAAIQTGSGFGLPQPRRWIHVEGQRARPGQRTRPHAFRSQEQASHHCRGDAERHLIGGAERIAHQRLWLLHRFSGPARMPRTRTICTSILASTANPASTGSASDPSLRVLRVDVAIVQRGIERIDEHIAVGTDRAE